MLLEISIWPPPLEHFYIKEKKKKKQKQANLGLLWLVARLWSYLTKAKFLILRVYCSTLPYRSRAVYIRPLACYKLKHAPADLVPPCLACPLQTGWPWSSSSWEPSSCSCWLECAGASVAPSTAAATSAAPAAPTAAAAPRKVRGDRRPVGWSGTKVECPRHINFTWPRQNLAFSQFLLHALLITGSEVFGLSSENYA